MRRALKSIVIAAAAISLAAPTLGEPATTQPATTQPAATQPAGTLRARAIHAAGVDRLAQVLELKFTFNVARDGKVVASRAWKWEPAKQRVTRTIGDQSHTYTRDKMADADIPVDRQFINDSFWLSPALHLSWAGEGVAVEDKGEVDLPIGEGKAHLLTMTYPAKGGYTPGDAYDLYLGDNDLIVAWNYRAGNNSKPSMTTTFEDYISAGPLQIAREHRTHDGGFRLFFTEVTAKVDE